MEQSLMILPYIHAGIGIAVVSALLYVTFKDTSEPEPSFYDWITGHGYSKL